MTVTLEWDNDQKTVLRYKFSRDWSWAEFFEAQQRRVPMLRDITHRVDHLVIFCPDAQLPVKFFYHADALDKQRFAYSVCYAVVSAPLLIKLTVSTLRHIDNSMANDTTFFDSEAAARAFLEGQLKPNANTTARRY